MSSCYLDPSSRGTFTYCKARLIRNELLEKEVGPPRSFAGWCGRAPCLLCLTCGTPPSVHREAAGDEAGGAGRAGAVGVLLLSLPRQVQGAAPDPSLRCGVALILKLSSSSGSSSGSVKRVWPSDTRGSRRWGIPPWVSGGWGGRGPALTSSVLLRLLRPQAFTSPNIPICYKSTPSRWAPTGTWLCSKP